MIECQNCGWVGEESELEFFGTSCPSCMNSNFLESDE